MNGIFLLLLNIKNRLVLVVYLIMIKNVLSVFTKYYTPEWLKEGITRDVHDYFGIGFSISHNSISIPHFGVTGNLVGIRGRRMDFETWWRIC